MNILFICTGNICRSPVAERMLQSLATAKGLDIAVTSAGTRALNGQPMHPQSERILVERGIDPGTFSSRMLTPQIVQDADLVLGMTREHRAFARQLAPVRWKRMFALREIGLSTAYSLTGQTLSGTEIGPTDSQLDIEDPVGKSGAVFDQVGETIYSSMEGIFVWIAHRTAITQTRSAN